MPDLNHWFGDDLTLSPTGDISSSDGTLKGQQRVLRRLLTNPGGYIWHPEYGAGLPAYVGAVVDIPKITALIRSQILLEDAVAKSPAPLISVKAIANGIACNIQYNDSATKSPVVLSFNVNV